MGIYRSQFLVGDKIEFFEKEYWIISIQQVNAELIYILMDDNLKTKTVCNLGSLGKFDNFKLIRRIIPGNKEILCNLCPLKNTLGNCSNFCDYYKIDLSYFFVGDRITLKLLPNGWEEVTAITLRDVMYATYIKYQRPLLEKNRCTGSYSTIHNLDRLLDQNKGEIMNSLTKGVTGIDTTVFFGKNYEPIRKTDFELKLRTSFAQEDDDPVDYFRELLCDQDELGKFENSWKLWIK